MSSSVTPSIKEEEEESKSTFNKTHNASYNTCAIDIQRERLVVGPDGNNILCDSPDPSELPPYSGPDNISPSTSRENNNQVAVKKRPSSSNKSSSGSSRRSMSTERAKPRRIIGNYTLINTLGSGSMGKVRLAVHNITGDKLAVKIVQRNKQPKGNNSKKKDKDEHREIRTIREASIMLLLHHPFIVSLKEMVILDPYYYLFMEYVNGGQLLDYIISHGKLKEKQARSFGRQIVSALDYCHRNSIVHRDLKIENILISQSGNIKIIDFGLSNLFSTRSSLNTFCGSLYFAAPELLNAKAYTGPEVDVWSFGVVLYVLVCGKVPFDDQSMPALHEKIKRGVVDYPSHLSTDCKSILSRMLVTNSAHRATISEIIINPWMNKGYDSPIDNYLPDRIPLSLPIDMEVVRGMTGFEFGSEIDIRDKLQNIIISEEYRKAAKILLERTAETHRNHRQNHNLSSRFSPHSSKKSFILPNEDPQSIPAAYHPLISIYYLVKERIEREKRLAAASATKSEELSSKKDSLSLLSTTTKSTSLRIPDISLPEHAHPTLNVPFEQSFIEENSESTKTAADKLHLIENGISRLFSTSSRRKSINSNHSFEFTEDNEDCDLNRSPTRDTNNNVFRRLSLALSRSPTEKGPRSRKSSSNNYSEATTVSTSTSTPIQSLSSTRGANSNQLSKSYAPPPSSSSKFPNSSLFETNQHPRSNNLQQQDVDIVKAAAATAAAAANASHNNNNTFGNKFSKILSRRMTLGQSSMNAEDHNNFLNMTHGNPQQQISTAINEGRLASTKRPVKTLPLHVDNDLTDQKMINYNRQHDHEQSFPSAADGSTSFQQKGTADENIKPVFLKGLFSVTTTSTKHPSVIRADLIRVLERIGVKWRESKGRFECVHMPSIDLNKVVLVDDDDDEDDDNDDEVTIATAVKDLNHKQPVSSEDAAAGGGANVINTTPVVPLPDLVVRFEIYIVKVPWLLGMHGLQFRRVGGDPWQYKNMCSKILAELKL